jgi:hypothetical protein
VGVTAEEMEVLEEVDPEGLGDYRPFNEEKEATRETLRGAS